MNAMDLIRQDEGSRLLPYTDSRGNLTWGIGHLMPPKGNPLCPAAVALLGQSVEAQFQTDYAAIVTGLSGYAWWATLNEVRQAAIADMAFNLGLEGFAAFTTFQSCLSSNQWSAAAADLRGTLVYQQLPNRYERLATMIQTGEWPA